MDNDLTQACIMIVEDDFDNRQLLELTFRTSGYPNVLEVSDGRKAVAVFAENRPDMVLVDQHMPHVDGVDIIRDINDLVPEGEFLPIVMLSGDVSADVRRRATECGASDFLLKPYEMSALIELVESSLRRRLEQQAVTSESDR
jgi:putative two-component system response regulator